MVQKARTTAVGATRDKGSFGQYRNNMGLVSFHGVSGVKAFNLEAREPKSFGEIFGPEQVF